MIVLKIIAEIYAGTAALSYVVLQAVMLYYTRNLPIRERISDAGWILRMSAVWPWTMVGGYRAGRKYTREGEK